MKRRVLFLLFLLPLLLSARSDRDMRLIIITIDGLRWQEVFGGADESLISNTKEVRDVDQLRRFYWRHTPVERRKALMPFVWNTIANQGILIGNRNLGSIMQVANKTNISFPGYCEMMTGIVDEDIKGNDPISNPHRNVFDAAQEDLRYKGNIMMYGSWKSTRYAIHNEEAHIPASVSYETNIAKTQTSTLQMVDRMMAGMPRYWRSEHFDAFTYAYAIETLMADHPKVMWISFGDCDEWAHARKYDLYLDAANATDAFIRDIYITLEADRFYQGKTAYLITCDHGRGAGTEWGSHGSSVKGSEATWLMLFGKGIKPIGETVNNGPFYTKQVAATIAALLDLEFVPEDGSVLPSIIDLQQKK